MSKNIPVGESRANVDTLIELYTNRKITQSTTVENIIKAYIGTKTVKQRAAVHKKVANIMEKYKDAQTLAERLATKKAGKEALAGQTKAASKIQKIVRGTVKFETRVLEKAMKDNVLRIGVEPTTLGSSTATDIEAFVARAYLMARRHLPKDAVFRVWGTCSFLYSTPTSVDNVMNKKTKQYPSTEIKDFFTAFITAHDRIWSYKIIIAKI